MPYVPTRLSVKSAFPDFGEDLPAVEGFKDSSWDKEPCPSLTKYDGEGMPLLKLWVDFREAERRLFPSASRYCLVDMARFPQTELIASTDDWDAITLEIDKRR